jgi:predicted nucleotidyltransferase component of viral defense system
LLAAARRLNAPIDVVELDYGQSYMLAALFGREELRGSLVFKGGTALHKVYFVDHRFSVDLDFTAVAGPRGRQLEQEIRDAAADAENMLDEYGPFEVSAARRAERSPHPAGQESFLVQVRFPWHGAPQRSIKLEVTVDEPLALAAENRPILHGYDESLAVSIPSYRLEEIVAEKLRTPLQAQKRADRGHWTRNCARDYYDLWRLLQLDAASLNRGTVLEILPAKCAVREVGYESVNDFFPAKIVEEAERQWDTSLGELVRPLLAFDRVVADLRNAVGLLIGS